MIFVILPQFFYRHHLSNKTANPWLFKEMIIKVTEEAGLYIDDFADYAL